VCLGAKEGETEGERRERDREREREGKRGRREEKGEKREVRLGLYVVFFLSSSLPLIPPRNGAHTTVSIV
jgi:hypothetical protein